MKLKITGSRYLLLGCFAFSCSVLASTPGNTEWKCPDRLELIGALGLASIKAGDSTVGVTSSERDALVSDGNKKWNSFAAQLGIGYIHDFHQVRQNNEGFRLLPTLSTELNIYYLRSRNIAGDVHRFGSSSFNQLTYKAPLDSGRLMLDLVPTIASYKRWSLYAKGGIGTAWNRMSYVDKDNVDSLTNQRLKLDADVKSRFAWELGAGIVYAFSERVGLSLEYLYADLGKAAADTSGNYGTITYPVIDAPDFRLKSRTVLLGLHVGL